MPWRLFLARSAIGAAMVGIAAFAGIRLATAEPGGSTGDALTFAGVLHAPDGGTFTGGNRTLTFVFHKGAEECRARTVPPMTTIPMGGAFSVRVVIPSNCSRPFFDGTAITYDVQASEESGNIVSGVTVTPVPYARYADQAGVNSDCPAGYVRVALDETVLAGAGVILCRRGRDEVVRVGDGASAFWIDRYEATIWNNSDGLGDRPVNSEAPDEVGPAFPRNGEWISATPAGMRPRSPWFGVSVRATGFAPARYVTWFQAASLCRASGKRLPTGEEWLLAATGTPDDARCAIAQTSPRRFDSNSCYSIWGAQDMVGNLWEWTTEWFAGTQGSVRVVRSGQEDSIRVNCSASIATGYPLAMDACRGWPDLTLYGGDMTWNIGGGTYPGDINARDSALPAAAERGGYWNSMSGAGRFALSLDDAPSQRGQTVGFRCVVPR